MTKTPLSRAFELMQDVENAHNVILKLEIFSDQTGDLYYSDNLRETDLFMYMFSFIDLKELVENLGNADEFFTTE